MTANEAYDEVMAVVGVLKARGVGVEIEPAKSRTNVELVAEYSGPERVAPDRWVHVHLFPDTVEQKEAIAVAREKLCRMGIGFDTGGWAGCRDWELDWSFRYRAKADSD
jgi:hypothetical protein